MSAENTMSEKSPTVEIVEGLARVHVEDALRVLYEAFANKFRIGFRNAEDLVRLFRGSVDRDSCLTAIVDGRLSGILAIETRERNFYELGTSALLTTFWPPKTARVVFNLCILKLGDTIAPDEFKVDSIAVDSASRGLGAGTALMLKAEEKARSLGKLNMSLHVLGDNTGAIRLYQRLGYTITQTERGFLVRLAVGSDEVHKMKKPLGDM